MKKIEIEIPDGKRAEWVNGVLILVDEKPKDVTERINTFEDACRELNKMNSLIPVHPFVRSYNAYKDAEHGTYGGDTDILAYLKLRIICAALNEGWEPQFTKDEYRYYPYLALYTKKEVEQMDEETKNELGLVLWGGSAYYGAYCGLAYANSGGGWSYSGAGIGYRLALKTRELAEYCGKQFINLWRDYLLRRK